MMPTNSAAPRHDEVIIFQHRGRRAARFVTTKFDVQDFADLRVAVSATMGSRSKRARPDS